VVSLFDSGKVTPESKGLLSICSHSVFCSQIVHPGTFTQCKSDLEASEYRGSFYHLAWEIESGVNWTCKTSIC